MTALVIGSQVQEENKDSHITFNDPELMEGFQEDFALESNKVFAIEEAEALQGPTSILKKSGVKQIHVMYIDPDLTSNSQVTKSKRGTEKPIGENMFSESQSIIFPERSITPDIKASKKPKKA